jgi:hypothetical protein
MPKKAEAPEDCQQYRRPKKEDAVKLCAELGGLRHLAVKNVIGWRRCWSWKTILRRPRRSPSP